MSAGVDHLGRRARAQRLTPGSRSGLSLALVAQHNLVLELAQLPTAFNLRRIMSLQALASREAFRLARSTDPDLASGFTERAGVYRQLLSDCRNLAGLVGAGGSAVVEGRRALTALSGADAASETDFTSLHALRRLFSATDARTSVLIERGVAERAYFVGVPVPRLGEQRVRGIRQPRLRYMPVDTQPRNPILPLVRERLRPAAPVRPAGPSQADRSELGRALSLAPRSRPRR